MPYRKSTRYTKALALFILATVGILLGLTILPLSTEAEVPYYSYSFNSSTKQVMSVPEPYEPQQFIQTGQQAGVGGLKNPKDLFIDKENRLYIADTGNNRILVADRD